MKNIIQTLTICFFSLCSYAQEAIIAELENALGEEKYDWIISRHSEKVATYPAKAIYYVGMAYYMKGDDKNALKLMDLSIKKDSTAPEIHFMKGVTLNYMEQFDDAIASFNKAIKLDAGNSSYFSGLGDSFVGKQEYNKALTAYKTATEKENLIDRPFRMIPQIYAELNQPEKALEAFYKAKEAIPKAAGSYINILYNIGLYEYLNKNYDKAEAAFKELIEIAPDDFQSHAKLIQVYYGKKEYEKAKPLREKLYNAYEQGILEDDLKEMFCFDQFHWKDKLILAYERFAVKEGKLYYKHIFYVINEKGKTEFTIQTENSPVSAELGGPKYAIGMNKDGTHSTFGFIEENFNYDNLKSIVTKILEKEINPTTSSTMRTSTKKESKKKGKNKRG